MDYQRTRLIQVLISQTSSFTLTTHIQRDRTEFTKTKHRSAISIDHRDTLTDKTNTRCNQKRVRLINHNCLFVELNWYIDQIIGGRFLIFWYGDL